MNGAPGDTDTLLQELKRLPDKEVLETILAGIHDRPDKTALEQALVVRMLNGMPSNMHHFSRDISDTVAGRDEKVPSGYTVAPNKLVQNIAGGATCITFAKDESGEPHILLAKAGEDTWLIPGGYSLQMPGISETGEYGYMYPQWDVPLRDQREIEGIARDASGRWITTKVPPYFDASTEIAASRLLEMRTGIQAPPEKITHVLAHTETSNDKYAGQDDIVRQYPQQQRVENHMIDLSTPDGSLPEAVVQKGTYGGLQWVKLRDIEVQPETKHAVADGRAIAGAYLPAIEKAITMLRDNELEEKGPLTGKRIAQLSETNYPASMFGHEAAEFHARALETAARIDELLTRNKETLKGRS